MAETQWFEVSLETLELAPASLTDWPKGMATAAARMQEECLESLIALNLEVLFPGEQLLLVCTQTQVSRMADVLAVDPVGMLRVIEVKKERVGHSDLEDQVVSYALQTHRLTGWPDLLAESLPDLPEALARSVEGFRQNLRAKVIGREFAREQFPEVQWKQLDRFAQSKLLLTEWRKRRKAGTNPAPLEDPRTEAMCRRLYGVGLREASTGNPPETANAILRSRWGCVPTYNGAELVLVAPELRASTEETTLGKRKALFCLVDAEVRAQLSNGVVTRAVLGWTPLGRTVRPEDARMIAALQQLVLRAEPAAAAFRWNPTARRLEWPDLAGAFMKIEERSDGHPLLVTASEWVTGGLADLKNKRIVAVRAIRQSLREAGVEPVGSKAGVEWQRGSLSAASEMLVAYYRACRELGFADRFRWHRRPPSAQ